MEVFELLMPEWTAPLSFNYQKQNHVMVNNLFILPHAVKT